MLLTSADVVFMTPDDMVVWDVPVPVSISDTVFTNPESVPDMVCPRDMVRNESNCIRFGTV